MKKGFIFILAVIVWFFILPYPAFPAVGDFVIVRGGDVLKNQNLIKNSRLSVFSWMDSIYKGSGVSVDSIVANTVTLAANPPFTIEVGQLFTLGGNGTAGVSTYEVTAVTGQTNFTIRGGKGNVDSGVTDMNIAYPGRTTNDAYNVDYWGKQGTLGVYRVDQSSGITKVGSRYALKCVPTTTADQAYYPSDLGAPDWLNQVAGRRLTFGLWVKSSDATYIRMVSSSGQLSFDVHTGGGDWEWLECSADVPENITYFYVGIVTANTKGTYYISSPMLIHGYEIGEGNYAPIQDEKIEIARSGGITLRSWGAITLTASGVKIFPQAETRGVVPYGVRTVSIRAQGYAGSSNQYFFIGADGSTLHHLVWTPAANVYTTSAVSDLRLVVTDRSLVVGISATIVNFTIILFGVGY